MLARTLSHVGLLKCCSSAGATWSLSFGCLGAVLYCLGMHNPFHPAEPHARYRFGCENGQRDVLLLCYAQDMLLLRCFAVALLCTAVFGLGVSAYPSVEGDAVLQASSGVLLAGQTLPQVCISPTYRRVCLFGL